MKEKISIDFRGPIEAGFWWLDLPFFISFWNFSSQRRHSSGSSLLEALDEEETKKLSECLEKILDVVGESMPEVLGKLF